MTTAVHLTEPPGAVTNARRWAVVGLLFTASLINYFDRATISFALPLISQDLQLGPEAKGVLLSAFFWSYTLMQIPMGVFADRMNLRWLYAGAFALWSVSQGLIGLATGLGSLIAFRVLLGIGEAIYLPGGSKIVSLLFKPAERGLPCGLFDAGTRTGLVLEGILVPWMLIHYGWRTSFAFVGFAALVWLIPWFAITPATLGSHAAATAGRRRPTRALATLVTNRNLLGICLGFFCFDYYWYFLVNWLPDYLVTSRGLTIVKAGIYAALPYFVFGLSEPIGGWIADRLIRAGWSETRARKVIVTIAFLTGLLLIPAARVTNPATAVMLIIGGCLVGLATGNLLVILQSCAPPDEIGLWTGIYNFVGNLAGILSPLLTGLLIAQTGSYTLPFVLAAVLIAIGPLAFWVIVGELGPGGERSR
ncbi:MAG TPA: MFS transporter [Vicinamibacterales bacterium]|jgi:MFS family permease|nr:MFS transporter [Vicinamibacterales bacterium]